MNLEDFGMIEKEKGIKEIVDNIIKNNGNKTKLLIKQLNQMVFDKYCMKGYLLECEPEYCVYRLNKTCLYICAIHYFKTKHGISLVYNTID
jgi:hypothetical protein